MSMIANRYSQINAQLYSASISQIFRMRLFVRVESASSTLLKTASKSGPNGCKERLRPQKVLMRIKIEGVLGRLNLVQTVARPHERPREEQDMIITWTSHKIKTKKNRKSSDMAIAPRNPTLWRGVPVAPIQKYFGSSGRDWKPGENYRFLVNFALTDS